MYNRYIPQNDGSYRRSRVQEPAREHPGFQPPAQPVQPEKPPLPETPVPRVDYRQTPPRRPGPTRPTAPSHCQGVGGFFKNLLPKDFDVEDLLIVLLLLLMAGDSQEEQNTALLTLALYLFL